MICAADDRSRLLIDFTAASTAEQWIAVDDRIMGGSSTSRVVFRDDATCFEGDLIVEGGGFASVRCLQPLALRGDVEALSLEAKGDGRMGYKLTLRSAAAPDYSYQRALRLDTSDYDMLRLPLESFKPTIRGRPAPEAPALRAADVRSVGLMLSRYEVQGGVKETIPAGKFCLSLRRLAEAESELAINGRRWVTPPSKAKA